MFSWLFGKKKENPVLDQDWESSGDEIAIDKADDDQPQATASAKKPRKKNKQREDTEEEDSSSDSDTIQNLHKRSRSADEVSCTCIHDAFIIIILEK